jgi:hypothetical protein
MSQIFKPSTNTLARVSLFGAVFFAAVLIWAIAELNRSAYATRQNVIRAQPVPFSHDHHVVALGIDCLYCHTTVEESAFAGIPPTATCINCLNHSIHVAKGIGCASCHGRVDQMPLMKQAVSLQMEWCLECHREPQKFVRPREEIYNMEWQAEDQEALGARLVDEYDIESLLSCSVCHR